MSTPFRPRRPVPVVFLLAAATVLATACRPLVAPHAPVRHPGEGYSFSFLAHRPDDGEPVGPIGCTIRVKVNPANAARFAPGSDPVAIVKQEAEAMTRLTTTARFAFTGTTTMTSESAAGKRFVAEGGVLVEFRAAVDSEGRRHIAWSQPQLDSSRRYWRGGRLWISAGPKIPVAAFRATVSHELGHQLGLGDLYVHQRYDGRQRMANPGNEWGSGDRAGAALVTARLRANGCR